MVVYLTLPHCEHDIWRRPSLRVHDVRSDRDRSHEMSNLFQCSDAASQLTVLFEPVHLLKLVQKFVIALFWKEQILVLWGNLGHVLCQEMFFSRKVRQFDLLTSFNPLIFLFLVSEACEVALKAFVVLLEKLAVDETTIWRLDLACNLSRENIR